MNEEQKEYQQPEAEASEISRPKQDTSIIVLLSIACGLCLGIIGVLAYWLSILK